MRIIKQWLGMALVTWLALVGGPASALDATTNAYLEQQETAFDAFTSCVEA